MTATLAATTTPTAAVASNAKRPCLGMDMRKGPFGRGNAGDKGKVNVNSGMSRTLRERSHRFKKMLADKGGPHFITTIQQESESTTAIAATGSPPHSVGF